MIILLSILIGILALEVILLTAKVILMRKSLKEISDAFSCRLTEDTNTLIDVSSQDKYIRKLAADINVQLKNLRIEQRRYLQGDRKLKDTVTNISHDLRTPLTAITGYIDLLQKSELSKKQKKHLGIIQKRAQELSSLTEELFRYALIANDSKTNEFTDVCVNEVLEESIFGFYAVFKEKGIGAALRNLHR